MNDPNIDNAPINTPIGPSHEPTIAALDRLANAERSAPPEGFEARIAEATRPGVIAHIDEHRARAHRQTTRVPLWWAVPIAAALAIAVVVLQPTLGPGSGPGFGPGTGPGAGPGSLPSGPIAMNTNETMLVALESDLDDFLFIDGLAESVSVFDGVSSLEALESNQSTPADQLIFDLLTSDGSTL